MKVLIDISDATYLLIKKSDKTAIADSVSKEEMMHSIKTGISISDNSTNDEAIKAFFPDMIEIHTDEKGWRKWFKKPFKFSSK